MGNQFGGGSNTHLTDTSSIKSTDTIKSPKLDKTFVIDWVSYTFDNVMYDEEFNKNTFRNEYTLSYSKTNDYILNKLLRIFQLGKNWTSMVEEDHALNGYKFSWLIGENIKINFAGPKSGRQLPTTQLLMSGSACREFEKYYGGKYFLLFDFFTKTHEELNNKKFNGHFKRIDIAIDDFTGKELNIYDLREYADNGHWVGSYQSCTFYYSNLYRGGITSKGYSLTFGSAGSNQLQIYDKKLEQESKNKRYIESDVWYRYEMRFTDPKSDKIVQLYMVNYINQTLNDFAYSLLISSVDFKIISNDKNKSRVETLHEWKTFCNYIKKIELKQELPSETSFEVKKRWIEKNLSTTITQLALAFGNEFVDYVIKLAEDGSRYIKDTQVLQIERFIQSNGKTPLPKKMLGKIKMKGIKLEYADIVSRD